MNIFCVELRENAASNIRANSAYSVELDKFAKNVGSIDRIEGCESIQKRCENIISLIILYNILLLHNIIYCIV